MKKQTAIDWLFAHLLPFLPFSDPKEREHFRKCLAEAKAMEREQIEEAWKRGNLPTSLGRVLTEKDYYNETYGDNK
jgi:hypothetical protein